MTSSAAQESPENTIDTSVAESSSYDLLKKRLEVQGDALPGKTRALNATRIGQVGQTGNTAIAATHTVFFADRFPDQSAGG